MPNEIPKKPQTIIKTKPDLLAPNFHMMNNVNIRRETLSEDTDTLIR